MHTRSPTIFSTLFIQLGGGGQGLVQKQSSVSYLRGLKVFLHDFQPWCPTWVKYDAYKTIWQFRVSCTTAQAWSSFSFASKWNYIYVCTVQQYSIFKANHTATEYTICSILLPMLGSTHTVRTQWQQGQCGIVWYACRNFYCAVSSKYITDIHSCSEHYEWVVQFCYVELEYVPLRYEQFAIIMHCKWQYRKIWT